MKHVFLPHPTLTIEDNGYQAWPKCRNCGVIQSPITHMTYLSYIRSSGSRGIESVNLPCDELVIKQVLES